MQKRRTITLAAISICLLACLFGCQAREKTAADRIREDVEFLCSDECYGRLPGSSGNDLARDRIQAAFEEAGLVPLEGYDSLLVPYQQTVLDMECQEQVLTVVFPDGSVKTFQAGVDFYPLQNIGVDGFSGEVATDPSDPDLKNKVYLARNYDSSVNAAAVVFENNRGNAIIGSGGYLALGCDSTLFAQLEGCSSLSLEGATAVREAMVDNVVGVLPGGDGNARDALLITAHFDHVGGYGDSIYRGALDNASGTAFMLEVMRQLAAAGNTAEYDIVFAAFNGEDMQMGGSKYLASHLPYDTVNVLNFDCVGYGEEPALGVVGEDKELQAAVVAALNDGLSCFPDDEAPGGSDHASFEELGIPAVTVSNYSGEINYSEIIHLTTDVPDILDFESIAAMADPVCRYALNGGLIQPKPQEQDSAPEQDGTPEESVYGVDQAVYARAREEIDAVGLPYDQVLPIRVDGLVYFVRDLSFLADVDAAEELTAPVKFPESLGGFSLDREAPLHGSSALYNRGDDDNELKYHVMVWEKMTDDTGYEIGVPQDITNKYHETQSWHLMYTDGDVILILTAFDREVSDLESRVSSEDLVEVQAEDGVIYQRFTTWESREILSAVYYTADGLPYYYVLSNSIYNPTALDDETMMQMMMELIPTLREIPKLP